ncbi:hypothetical protein [Streptomyces sp. NPDC005281]|uniref:hypothetical protein n=1 Tax=Streptomyces sp. NPDC005281 TaxID=3155712 RepID=UPI0033A11EE0
MPLNNGADVRVFDANVAQTAQDEVCRQAFVEYPFDGAEEFELALVIDGVACVVEEGGQRWLETEFLKKSSHLVSLR